MLIINFRFIEWHLLSYLLIVQCCMIFEWEKYGNNAIVWYDKRSIYGKVRSKLNKFSKLLFDTF